MKTLKLNELEKSTWLIFSATDKTIVKREARSKKSKSPVIQKKLKPHDFFMGQLEYVHNGVICFYACYGCLDYDYWWVKAEDVNIEAAEPVILEK